MALHKTFKKLFWSQSNEAQWTVDLTVTFLFCLFWVWFGYQYGFRNTPDAWYRGVLAKSILDGHPYFVNLKQGYVYDFGPLHHDATHPPFMPLLMAGFFLIFGAKIVFANLVACISAGLLILPLIRISRELCKTALIGYAVYFFTVFNEKADFLFETLHGLSIPTTMLLLSFFLYFYLLTWKYDSKINPILSGLFLAGAALNRFDAESVSILIVAFHLVPALFFWVKKDHEAIKKILFFVGVYSLIMTPWIVRNVIVFKDPFFNHASPMIWTDNGLEYWDYHEGIPLPSAKTYFEKHRLKDFPQKISDGLGNVYKMVDKNMLSLPLWLYLFALSMFSLLVKIRKREEFLFYSVIFIVTMGYLVPFAIIPYLDPRYMIPLILMTAFTCLTAFYIQARAIHDKLSSGGIPLSISLSVGKKTSTLPLFNILVLSILVLTVYFTQRDFWMGAYKEYFLGVYTTEDSQLASDPMVQTLNNQFKNEDVILGPFAGVQRLNFATGRTLVEIPANLKNLDYPFQFFKKYQINYSLIDVSDILPAKFTEDTKIGNSVIYKINLEVPEDSNPRHTAAIDIHSDETVRKSIQEGKREKRIFIDISHGGLDGEFKSLLRAWGYNPISPPSGFQGNQEKLFQSGILIMSYKIGGGELRPGEMNTIKRFIDSGGNLLLLCPIWVWTTYDHKPLDLNPYNQIGEIYNLKLVEEYQKGGVQVTQNAISRTLSIKSDDRWGNFSRVISSNPMSISLIEDEVKNSFGVAATLDKSKIILIGQNFLTQSNVYKENGDLSAYTTRLIDWLLSEN